MRVRQLLLVVALSTALVPGPTAHADLNYRAEITGVGDSELADLLDNVSELKSLEDKPPASEEALRRRAERDLGRLADAAHSLGYWDAEFSYDVDTASDPARVTVTVMSGPLYHVASVKVLGPDGQPLSIPQDEKKLPLKPGEPARTAPVVAAETALLAVLGDSGHPFAKVENRRVEIDNGTQTMDLTCMGRSCVSGRLRSRARAARSRLCRGAPPLAVRPDLRRQQGRRNAQGADRERALQHGADHCFRGREGERRPARECQFDHCRAAHPALRTGGRAGLRKARHDR